MPRLNPAPEKFNELSTNDPDIRRSRLAEKRTAEDAALSPPRPRSLPRPPLNRLNVLIDQGLEEGFPESEAAIRAHASFAQQQIQRSHRATRREGISPSPTPSISVELQRPRFNRNKLRSLPNLKSGDESTQLSVADKLQGFAGGLKKARDAIQWRKWQGSTY